MSIEDESPAPLRDAASRAPVRLHRVIWRWHFYAGIFVAPIVFVLALTGGIYIFRDDLEPLIYQRSMIVEPQSQPIRWANVIASAEAHRGPDSRARFLTVHGDPRRAARVSVAPGASSSGGSRAVWVDPYTATALDDASRFGVFEFVLLVHRKLLLSTIGRIVVEIAVSWSIVLFLTGLWLWAPRRLTQAAGVWYPRWRAKPYTVLRDVHVVSAIYLLPIAATIALTGLLYTSMFGWFWDQAKAAGDAGALFRPPVIATSAKRPALPIDDVVRRAKTHFAADSGWSVQLPKSAGESWLFAEMTPDLTQYRRIVAIDAATGETIRNVPEHEFPALLWWSNLNYALHIGSVLGWPTKLLWAVACLVLMTLPVTGYLMWRRRAPEGGWGLPRKPQTRLPAWLIATIVAFAVVLPGVALSLAAVLVYERYPRRAPQAS